MNLDIAKLVVFNYLKEDAISVNPIVGKGIVNKIYVVRTANHEVVIRMNNAPSSFREYEKERWCIQNAIDKGIPSPEVLTIGKIGNTAYMIQTYIGVNGVDTTLDKTYISFIFLLYFTEFITTKFYGERYLKRYTSSTINTFNANAKCSTTIY